MSSRISSPTVFLNRDFKGSFRQVIVWCVLSVVVSLSASVCSVANARDKPESLKAFTSDGCSAFPNGTIQEQELWLQCCYEHDLAYWKGGTFKQRYNADLELRQCVAKVGEPEIANLMLAGVRVGGTPFLPTPFRWAYGWPYPRGYKALTQSEEELIQRQLKALKK